MVYETITFENIDEFVDSLEIKNKDNFKIDFSHTNFISLLSNDKDDFVRFNINVMYHNTNRNGELMFSKQNLTNFKNKIKLIETIFEFKKFITSDMNVEFIFVKNNNDLRFNIKLTSNVEGTSKTVAVKATDNAMTYKVAAVPNFIMLAVNISNGTFTVRLLESILQSLLIEKLLVKS